jgi:large subunit ribosomal protein L10
MALTKDKKNEVISEVLELLNSSKMTVITQYKGTPVKALQDLRRQARDNGTKVKVVKNRLVIKALEQSDSLKGVDTKMLEGMLLYAFNSEDEVAPAQVIDSFAKTNPSLVFVGAITADGEFMGADEVKSLAKLPGKAQLVAGIISTLQSPLRGAIGSLSGNLHGYLDAIAASKA